MKYRHWFWDFDGTLFNTYPRICRALQKSLADAGIFEETSVIMPYLKQSLETAARHFGDEKGVGTDVLLEGYHRHSEEEGPSTIRPFPGARDFLCDVISSGGKNYLYTHRGESVFKALERERFSELFCDMVTSLDGFPSKPAPDALLFLMNKHSLDPDECVMVGDRLIDLGSGINARMHAICVDPDGFCPPQEGIPLVHDYAALSKMLRESLKE